MPNLGAAELVIILVLALLILGPKRLPATARSLGRGMREFKDAITGRDARPGLAARHELDAELAAVPERPREPAEA
jgi:sec-independent protein translocase protein TatA